MNDKTDLPEKLLTIKQVAEILAIHPKTVYEWAKLGKIPSVKLFNEIRFRKSDIDEIVKNGLQKEDLRIAIQRPKTKKKQIPKEEVFYWDRPFKKVNKN